MYAASCLFAMWMTQIALPVIVEEPPSAQHMKLVAPTTYNCTAPAPSCARMYHPPCIWVNCSMPNCQTVPIVAPPPHIAVLPKPQIVRNPRIERPFSMNFNYAGPALIGFSITAFFTPNIQAEVGFGPLTKYAGATYHFGGENPRKTWTPYTGLMIAHVHEFFETDDNTSSSTWGTYVPFGVQYSGRGGFLFALEGAWVHVRINGEFVDLPWFGLKFGYRF